MKKIICHTTVLILSFLIFSTIAFADTNINVQEASQGRFQVIHSMKAHIKYKVVVKKQSKQVVYDLLKPEETFSFTLGSGHYTIMLMENVSGTKYRALAKKEVNVTIDEMTPYLLSVQQIDWEGSYQVRTLTKTLTKNAKNNREKIEKIYDHLLENISYDYEKAQTIQPRYVPNLGEVLEEKSGICFDHASLLAGMLRSEGIPTKLVKGYRSDIPAYHSWNEVYFDGKWQILDLTVGISKAEEDIMIQNRDFYKSEFVY